LSPKSGQPQLNEVSRFALLHVNLVPAEVDGFLPEGTTSMKEIFRKFAQTASNAVGSYWSFLIAFAVIVVWGITGPIYKYSDTWQLVMNTVSSVVTFLMVFLIQNAQNRDSKAIQLKLNELLRGVKGARTGLVNLESLSDEDLMQLHQEFERLGERAVSLKNAQKPKP
jgi:low affinity Fe/Cu permease